ncbi:PCYCGC motif-containing lipoprotein [Aneurinibacillus sp. Ricciae_BoGa-3]|uniref:PCYCGC motif-containing (lipo)protein n=1 Tax=Aneurinibacillus sp. Ricciae_BoGa-3 TaxID=3022697 RepID=UPI002341AD2D|nr:PCYCGC motif-containing (lipo)protein [Aneurinibacillus sp. Ricciae_BoGa-3]WCK55613.1 PCYCGC motif-containing lipoprotein [Aneurinibacillus sp. Ricciae_BoGa-3]
MTRKRKLWTSSLLVVTLLLSGLVAGCSSSNSQLPSNAGKMVMGQGGDKLETTASVHQLPSFLTGVDPQIVEVYKTAAAHPKVLENMACYCSCGQSAGHKSNLSCFIQQIKPDGKVVWDSHGIMCNTCQNIAMEAVMLHQKDPSLRKIRLQIDKEYKEGYAKPTPTPVPAA